MEFLIFDLMKIDMSVYMGAHFFKAIVVVFFFIS